MGELYQGAVAPEDYAIGVGTGDSGLDMTTVSAASFKVFKPGGVEVTWAATISAATAASLILTHVFSAAPTEVDKNGDYVIYAILTIPGGFMTTSRILKPVRSKYAVVR